MLVKLHRLDQRLIFCSLHHYLDPFLVITIGGHCTSVCLNIDIFQNVQDPDRLPPGQLQQQHADPGQEDLGLH